MNEKENDDFEAELSNRWDHLRHIAYAIDGEPGFEADLLNAALLSFPECTLEEDLPGYAVRRLLKSLLLNRGVVNSTGEYLHGEGRRGYVSPNAPDWLRSLVRDLVAGNLPPLTDGTELPDDPFPMK
jgi:hypothetical protein